MNQFTFIIVLFLIQNVLATLQPGRRKVLLEIEHSELNKLTSKNNLVAVLFYDDSEIGLKASKDLELINGDSERFGIIWRKIKTVDEASTSCEILFYREGEPIPFLGKPDRQTSVFQWIITELYCYLDSPINVNINKYEILIKSFRNFVLLMESTLRPLQNPISDRLSNTRDVCSWLNNVLIVQSVDDKIYEYLGYSKFRSYIVNIVNGIPRTYTGSFKDDNKIYSWIKETLQDDVLSLGESDLDKMLQNHNEIMVLFTGSNTKKAQINKNLNESLDDFEISYDLPIFRVLDEKVAKSYGVYTLPQIVLFLKGKIFKFENTKLTDQNVLSALEEWIVQKLHKTEKTVIKSISSTMFKNSPDNYKNVLVKDHDDVIRKLSKEYSKLQRENNELKVLIKSARDILQAGALYTGDKFSEDKSLTAECGDCLSSVGVAIWNCGTLEIECIKNFIDVGSECYGCLCEIMDSWWPEDAPNCFKKEIKVISSSFSNKKELK